MLFPKVVGVINMWKYFQSFFTNLFPAPFELLMSDEQLEVASSSSASCASSSSSSSSSSVVDGWSVSGSESVFVGLNGGSLVFSFFVPFREA